MNSKLNFIINSAFNKTLINSAVNKTKHKLTNNKWLVVHGKFHDL